MISGEDLENSDEEVHLERVNTDHKIQNSMHVIQGEAPEDSLGKYPFITKFK